MPLPDNHKDSSWRNPYLSTAKEPWEGQFMVVSTCKLARITITPPVIPKPRKKEREE